MSTTLVEAKSLSCKILQDSCKQKFVLQDLAKKSLSCKILANRQTTFKKTKLQMFEPKQKPNKNTVTELASKASELSQFNQHLLR